MTDPLISKKQEYSLFSYAIKGIRVAMHDWDPDNILNGQKAVIVFD